MEDFDRQFDTAVEQARFQRRQLEADVEAAKQRLEFLQSRAADARDNHLMLEDLATKYRKAKGVTHEG